MTDVHFHPQEAGTFDRDRGVGEQIELAAFEKGRMQGEMEAIRRMEAEQGAMQLKQFPAEHVQTAQRPDVVEINRLTWLQRAAWTLGEAAAVAYLVMTIFWLHEYRGNLGWSDDYAGDNNGNIGMYNTHLLTAVLGLFCITQAITMYRVLPLNLNPWINRGIYVFWQCCGITALVISLVGMVQSTPEATFWGVEAWCFALALTTYVTHALYSMARTLIEPARPVDYETWAEVNNHITESAEQRRDRSTINQAGRTVYAPAPVSIPHTRANLPPANSNVGAQVPVAPANAPRWAENPNTHAENYFLLPRAKWAVCSYFAVGACTLMFIAVTQHNLAAGKTNWSQGPDQTVDPHLGERSNQSDLISATGLIMLFSILAIAYAAMPPRTTLVKNGILVDPARRSSVSHNAETRIGNIV